MDELRILTPSGMLGYGICPDLLSAGLARGPDAIVIDSGSTDSGPHKLGLGMMTCSSQAYERDLATLIEAGAAADIPVYVTSAGGDGSNLHVDHFVSLARMIAVRSGLKLRTAYIYANIDKGLVGQRFAEGRVAPLGPVPPLRCEDIEDAAAIVAQMGEGPIIDAVSRHGKLDLVITGRTYDPAPVAALGIAAGFPPALAWHMGKIMECGGLCAEPTTSAILGVLRHDHFHVSPIALTSRCTPQSVAAHTLYEKSHPYFLTGPGGTLDVSDANYTAVDERTVRVSGSRFKVEPRYKVKLEGAVAEGYRAIAIQAARDPAFIAALDDLLQRAEASAQVQFEGHRFRISWHRYGIDGVLGEFEADLGNLPKELCLISEVEAEDQETALSVCGHLRTWLLHADYADRVSTSGNVASPFTPLEIPLGRSCRFSIYHLMELDDPGEVFPIHFEVLQ